VPRFSALPRPILKTAMEVIAEQKAGNPEHSMPERDVRDTRDASEIYLISDNFPLFLRNELDKRGLLEDPNMHMLMNYLQEVRGRHKTIDTFEQVTHQTPS
jgi:hypothetical protein